MTSLPTVKEALSLLKRTQGTLVKSNLRLHKIAANNKEVMEAFPHSDHSSDSKDLNVDVNILPIQYSLGIKWDLQTQHFLFTQSDEVKPYTQQGVQPNGKQTQTDRTSRPFVYRRSCPLS